MNPTRFAGQSRNSPVQAAEKIEILNYEKYFTIIFVLVLFIYVPAQEKEKSSPELQEADKFSAESVKYFQQKRYQEALSPAQKSLMIYEQKLGAENIETARSHRNLGFIFYFLDQKKEARKSFERSLEIYQKQPQLDSTEGLNLAGMLEILAVINYENKDFAATRKTLEKILAVYEKYTPDDSLKMAKTLTGIGNMNISEKNYTSAAEAYEKSLSLRLKKLKENEFETIDVFNRCLCSFKKAGKESEIERVHLKYFPEFDLTGFGTLQKKEKDITGQTKNSNDNQITLTGIPLNILKDAGVVNGSAISLIKPAYPAEARRAGAEGTVKVSVTINEAGDVIFACGAFNKVHWALIESAEIAAYNSKFQPTLVNGKPIKVSGLITYNFKR